MFERLKKGFENVVIVEKWLTLRLQVMNRGGGSDGERDNPAAGTLR